MSCTNCYPTYPFPGNRCASSSRGVIAEPVGCRPHLPFLKENFTVGDANVPFPIVVTDTQSLFIGQGILIGSGFYQITDIIDSITLEVAHDNLGATAGTTIIAVHPVYGCYQYPIVPIGIVNIASVPQVVALEDDRETLVPGGALNVTAKLLRGYVGPTTMRVQVDVVADIDNAPVWVGVRLPVPLKSTPLVTLAGYLNEGSLRKVATVVQGVGAYSQYILIGVDEVSALATATSTFVITGEVEVAP